MEDQTQAASQPTVTQPAPEVHESQTLAKVIRTKFPGAYDDLPDTVLEQKWIAKYPAAVQFGLTHVSPEEAIAAMHKTNAANGDVENVQGGIAGAFTRHKPADLGEEIKHGIGAAAGEVGHAVAGLPNAVMHPIDTILGTADAMRPHAVAAVKAVKAGEPVRAFGEAASAFPVVGPSANAIGEEMGRTGDVSRAVGRGAALVGMTAGPEMLKPVGATARAAGSTSLGDSMATALENVGGRQVAKAITPVRGAGATKFAGMANDIGPELATDPALSGVTKPGFHVSIQSELGKAGDALDMAADARLKNKPIDTAPITKALEDRLASKTQAQPLNASRVGPPTQSTPTGQNIGIGPGTPHPSNAAGMAGKAQPMGSVVNLSDPQTMAHAEQLQKAIDEIKTLGPQTSYEALQKIRQSYDNVAKPGVYVTQPSDVLTAGRNVGSARGAADVAGTVRETLAQADPVTARANARYSLMRRADDVLEALKISEQTRPSVGRTMMAAGLGAMGGGKLGAVVGPLVDIALRSGPDYQLVMGRTLGQMAEMLRKGNTTGAEALAAKLQKTTLAGEAGQQK